MPCINLKHSVLHEGWCMVILWHIVTFSSLFYTKTYMTILYPVSVLNIQLYAKADTLPFLWPRSASTVCSVQRLIYSHIVPCINLKHSVLRKGWWVTFVWHRLAFSCLFYTKTQICDILCPVSLLNIQVSCKGWYIVMHRSGVAVCFIQRLTWGHIKP